LVLPRWLVLFPGAAIILTMSQSTRSASAFATCSTPQRGGATAPRVGATRNGYTEEADRNGRATAAIAKLDFGAQRNKASP
jgi:hypothetical protein